MSSIVATEDLFSGLKQLEASVDAVCSVAFDSLTNPERLAFLERLERIDRRLAVPRHALIQQLAEQASPSQLGGTSLPDVLSRRLSISRAEARRRIGEAADLAPRRSLTGELLGPRLAATADAERAGDIGPEHVRVIRGFLAELPTAVDAGTCEAAESQLAGLGRGLRPEGLRQCADRLSALINPDGNFSDVDRARRRGLSVGRQGADGLTPVTGLLDPETRAYLDAVLAKWAAPGMCNPEDESPTVTGEPTEDAITRDARSSAQRNHDAVKAAMRSVLASGELGVHRGLPVTVVVSTTLQELQSAAGGAVTGGGSLLPMSDLIRMATTAYHYLAVFDGHTERALYLARTKRIASADQRVVLHARDRGCSHPDCTVPGYLCEVHHVDEWTDDGPTDIDNLTFACGPHHRLLRPGGWSTRKDRFGRIEWLPPPQLQMAGGVNSYHHPDRLLTSACGRTPRDRAPRVTAPRVRPSRVRASRVRALRE